MLSGANPCLLVKHSPIQLLEAFSWILWRGNVCVILCTCIIVGKSGNWLKYPYHLSLRITFLINELDTLLVGYSSSVEVYPRMVMNTC